MKSIVALDKAAEEVHFKSEHFMSLQPIIKMQSEKAGAGRLCVGMLPKV